MTREVDKDIPEGMSKSQWKKLKRKAKWEETKDKFREVKREKKKQSRLNRKEKIHELMEKGDLEKLKELYPSKSNVSVTEQIKSNIKLIVDCSYDEYMNEKEVVSLSNQITRAYSDNRRNKYSVDLLVSSFDKRLKERFDSSIGDYKNWDKETITFEDRDLDEILTLSPQGTEPKQNVIFLSADTDDELEDLKEGDTYIIGGIVDKGRHKNLCENKAKGLNIITKRLPIDKYIQISGRRVLATSHVIEILIKYLEFRDWKLAFEYVMPARKMKSVDIPPVDTPVDTPTDTPTDTATKD